MNTIPDCTHTSVQDLLVDGVTIPAQAMLYTNRHFANQHVLKNQSTTPN